MQVVKYREVEVETKNIRKNVGKRFGEGLVREDWVGMYDGRIVARPLFLFLMLIVILDLTVKAQ